MHPARQLRHPPAEEKKQNPVPARPAITEARVLAAPIMDAKDALVKEALYMSHPPAKGEDSSLKADKKLLEFQVARDELKKRYGGNARIELVLSEGEPMKVLAELAIQTEEAHLGENIEKAASDKGFSLVFQAKNLQVLERLSGPSKSPDDSGVWRIKHVNLYVIRSRDGSATSRVEDIAETAKSLLALADEIPKIMDEDASRNDTARAEKERLKAKAGDVTYPAGRPIDWGRVLQICYEHYIARTKEP